MKFCFPLLAIILSIIIVTPIFAQTQKKVDTSYSTTSYSNFFKRNSVIDKIEFYSQRGKFFSVTVFPKTIWEAKGFNYTANRNYELYNFTFMGDQYLFEKKYGHFYFPKEQIDAISRKTCDLYYYINGTITLDSIRLNLTYNCPSDDPEEKYFEKVEAGIGYKGGIKILKQQLEAAINQKNISLPNYSEDSVLIFNTILDNKDSSLKRIELIEGKYSAFSQIMMEVLIKSGPWFPPLQGGRPVKAYFKIFIRLHKGNSITVAIPEY